MTAEGAFIWANFPFGHPPEARLRPGPSPHIAYVLGSRSSGGRVVECMLAYTSSGAWRGTRTIRPLGVIEFTEPEAKRLNQRAFHIDLRCLARVPPTVIWLPGWDDADRGIVAIAPRVIRDRILHEAERLAKPSPEIVEIRGIGSRGPMGTRRSQPA